MIEKRGGGGEEETKGAWRDGDGKELALSPCGGGGGDGECGIVSLWMNVCVCFHQIRAIIMIDSLPPTTATSSLFCVLYFCTTEAQKKAKRAIKKSRHN